jgi:flagellar hook-associated protein 1
VAILGAAFQIGRSALAAYQAAITITGQNIANVGNANYTRQSGRLTAVSGGLTLAGVSPGLGVNLDGIQRHFDAAVEARLQMSLAARSGAQTTHDALNQVEGLYSELSDYDLSSQLTSLFNSFTNVQTDPQAMTAREQVLAKAQAVVRTIQRQRSGLLTQIDDLNHSAVAGVTDANTITAEIAQLNEQIATAQTGGTGGDSGLRDRRDGLLRDLSELMEIQTREQPSGAVNVYVGSEPLVEYGRARALTADTTRDGGVERVQIRFADSQAPVTLRSGKLAAIITTRDDKLAGQLNDLDQLARGLIYETNRVHSTGTGLVGYTNLTGSYPARDSTAPLNDPAAGLPFPVQNGTFLVNIRDTASGQVTTHMIPVDLDGLNGDDTSLGQLTTALDDLPGLSASLTSDNRLQISTDSGFEVSFAEDTSGALAALGIGTFFDGTDAATLRVNTQLQADPRLLASSLNGAPGDGGNAGRLAAVGTTASSLLGARSVQDFHAGMTNRLAVDTAAAQNSFDASDAVYSSLLAQRESASGVSLDEEAINLTMFERSFQGASRYLSVLDTLSTEILTLVGTA